MINDYIFEEKQNGLALILGIALVFTMAISAVAIYMVVSAGQNAMPAMIPVGITFIVLLLCLLVLGKMTIRLDTKTLSFGFAPFVIRIPVEKISRLELARAGIGKTWGLGIRLSFSGRFYYNTFWGNVIEVDFPGRKYGFSIKDPDGFIKAFKSLRPDLVIEA